MRKQLVINKGEEHHIFRWGEGDELQIFSAACEKFEYGIFDRLDLFLVARALDFLPEGDIMSFIVNDYWPIC